MTSAVRRFSTLVSYPFAICSAYVLFALLSSETSMVLASYAVVLYGAALVTIHECLLPSRDAWNPTWFDISNDVTYMLVGQVLLERLLTLVAFFVVVTLATNSTWQVPRIWPYSWPIWFQAVLVLVVGDFFRYWLHRAFHRFRLMWRLHAVHHSPERLYWLNVGRFHPLEQALQFVVDALPFIVLGIGPDVLSIYFVFYAINGFYQHSNCHVRLGWLNWVVAGPELHRWHHSLNLQESNTNYGNNLILWDMLFGTRFLPKESTVGTLGIPVRGYPMSFLRQMAAPFDRRISMGQRE